MAAENVHMNGSALAAEASYPPPRRTISRLFEVLLLLLFAGLTLNDKMFPWMAPVDRWLGIVLVLTALFSMFRAREPLKTEVLLFVLFVAWSTVTGFLVASNQSAVTYYVRLMAQEAALFLAITEYTRDTRGGSFVFGLLLLGALGVLAYQVATGGTIGVVEGTGFRATSVYKNPNSLGIACIFGLFGVAYFLRAPNSPRLRLWPALAIPVLLFFQITTGARLTFVAFGVFVLLWLALCLRTLPHGLRALIWVVLLLFTAFVLYRGPNSMLKGTVVGHRLQNTVATPEADPRWKLYNLGWEAFTKSPLFGVGLGNFAVVYGQYTHSDYMETLSTTGFVGFILYFAIYLTLWRRLSRCQRGILDATTEYRINSYKAMILTMLFLAVGAPNVFQPQTWLLLGAITGHSCVVERSLALQPEEETAQ